MEKWRDWPEVEKVKDLVWVLRRKGIGIQGIDAHDALDYLVGYVQRAAEGAAADQERIRSK